MGKYKALPTVTCAVIERLNPEAEAVTVSVGDSLLDVIVQGAYENPIVGGKVVGFCLRKRTGGSTYGAPAYDGVVVRDATTLPCKAFATLADDFEVSHVVLETEEKEHIQVAVGKIISFTYVKSGEENEVDPPYGKVLIAGLHDNKAEDPIPDNYLTPEALNYSFKVTSVTPDNTWNIAIKAKDVPHVENADHTDGCWVGVLFVAPEGATSVKRAGLRGGDVSQLPEMTNYTPLDNAPGGKKCIGVYLNRCNSANEKLAYRFQWDNQEEPTTFVIDISGVSCTDKRPDKE